jgi:3-hydroxyisobutyrate dehydrogenase-like beta-hydroxyacid dehydrogenase
MKIGFLGLGKMGVAIARRLIAGGHEVTVWNRDQSKAKELVEDGAKLAVTAAQAAKDQQAIVTMLFDDTANEAVLFGEGNAIFALEPGALHIACSTISVALSDRLAQEHQSRGQQYVAAPVFGRPNIAAEGKLWIVAAGEEASVAKARPLLESCSRGITVVGERPSQAHALKLAGNFLITMMIQSLSEAAVFGKAHGIEESLLLETVNSALFQSPFYAAYSKVMLDPPTPPGATVSLGVKDLSLFLSAAKDADVHLAIAEQITDRFKQALAFGLADADWAAGMLQTAEKSAHSEPEASTIR